MKPVLNIVLLASLVSAGTVSQGGNCSVANTRIDPVTHRLLSDCNDVTFCSPQSTCEPKQCRRDEFPFGYARDDVLPPLCPYGQYCPDEGSACTPWIPPGEVCQLNRDDECAPPSISATEIPDPHLDVNPQIPVSIGVNTSTSDAALCLHSICMYANATLGTPCTADTNVYIGPGPRGTQLTIVVTRDNCRRPGLFCDSGICARSRDIGKPCQHDQECSSYYCNVRNVCADPPATSSTVPTWQYVLTGATVLLAMLMTCVFFALVHRRHRKLRHAEVREYYREQLGYRKSIIALYSASSEPQARVLEKRRK